METIIRICLSRHACQIPFIIDICGPSLLILARAKEILPAASGSERFLHGSGAKTVIAGILRLIFESQAFAKSFGKSNE